MITCTQLVALYSHRAPTMFLPRRSGCIASSRVLASTIGAGKDVRRVCVLGLGW